MKKIRQHHYFRILALLALLLLLMKIDYRISSFGNFNPTDDAGYMYHAYSIGLDFDLDYSNQIFAETEVANPGFYLNGDLYIPKHPIGTGVLASPFIFLGSLFEKLNIKFEFSEIDQVYFFYSLSSIFYFFISILLLSKVINNSPKFEKVTPLLIFYLFLGSGIAYYSFERFSMTHTYEVFSISLLFFISYKNINGDKNQKNFLIGLLSILFLTIRWVNIFIIFIPFLYYLLIEKKESIKNLLRSKYYFSGLIIGICIFLLHTKALYGVYTINPKFVYRNNISLGFLEYSGLDSYFGLDIIKLTFKSLGIIFFSTEFGLLFFSPILFFLGLSVVQLIIKKEIKIISTLVPIVGIPFGIVILWQATGSAYGYRYLSCLIPVSILLTYRFLDKKFLKALYSLNFISIYLFFKFETNQLTSLQQEVNTFGRLHNYSGKNYMKGVLEGVLEVNTYLVFIMTSFFAVVFFKAVISLFSLEVIEGLIDRYGYMNGDVERFLEFTTDISIIEISVLIIFFYYFSMKLLSMSKVKI